MKRIHLFILIAAVLAAQNARPAPVLDSSKIVKVLTFNILHGATMKGDFNLDVIARVIKEADPDIVALQEVDFKTNRARTMDLATELGWRTKMIPLFARAMWYDGGEYGNGILSKYTFIKTRKVELPCTPGNEPRVAVEITVVLPSKDTIAFVATHLDSRKDEKDRIDQANEINGEFASNRYPTLLAGDLNATPESIPIKVLQKIWTADFDNRTPAPTFPSVNPTKKIDYVMFVPKNRWKVIDNKVIPDSVASDHCAYLVTLELLSK